MRNGSGIVYRGALGAGRFLNDRARSIRRRPAIGSTTSLRENMKFAFIAIIFQSINFPQHCAEPLRSCL